MERFAGGCPTRFYQAKNKCLIAVSEGIHRADGAFIAEGVFRRGQRRLRPHPAWGAGGAAGRPSPAAGALRQGAGHRVVPPPALRRPQRVPDRHRRGVSGGQGGRGGCGRRVFRQDGGLPVHPGGRLPLRDCAGTLGYCGQRGKRRFPAPGSTRWATAWSSPSSTTCSP